MEGGSAVPEEGLLLRAARSVPAEVTVPASMGRVRIIVVHEEVGKGDEENEGKPEA